MPSWKSDAIGGARATPGVGAGAAPTGRGRVGFALAVLIVVRAASEGSAGSDGASVEPRRALLSWRGHGICSLAWSPEGRRLAASGWGPEVRLWDLETGIARSLGPDDGAPRFVLGWSPDSRGLAVGDLGGRVDTWDVVEGPRDDEDPATTMATPHDLRAMASARGGASIRLLGPIDGRSRLLPAARRSANSMAFTPDGRLGASAGLDGVVRVWEVESGRICREVPVAGIGINCVTFSADGGKLASGGGGAARVWDVASGRELAALGDPSGGFSTLAFSPDGRSLAGATWAGRILVWDLATGRERASLPGHDRQILALAWSPDGARLASAGHDATVRIWELATAP